MRKTIALALILVAQPASAEACHRFSRWYYPYPQRCSVARQQVKLAAFTPDVLPPPRMVDPSPEPKPPIVIEVAPASVPEFVLPSLGDWEEISHEAAVTKLRLEMQGKWKDR